MKILHDILGGLSHSKSSEQFSCLSSLRNNISKGKIITCIHILVVQRSVCIVAPLLKIIFTGQKVIFPNLRDLRNLLKIIGSFPFYFISFYLFCRDRGIDNRINWRLRVIFSYISKKDDKEMKA